MNYFEKGNELYNTQDYSNAIKFYMKSIDSKEHEACSYYNAGVCFIKLKSYEKAITMLENALDFKYDSKYFFNLGYCYSLLENFKKALIYFNISWSLNNSDEDCEKAINILLKKIKNKKSIE